LKSIIYVFPQIHLSRVWENCLQRLPNTFTRSIKTIHFLERIRRFVYFWHYCHWRWFWRK